MKYCIALFAGWAIVLATPVIGQEGTARRTSLGDTIGQPSRYAEDTGWNNSNFSDSTWGVEYGTELNNGDPWTVVLQEGRTNAVFTAGANKLTFDLGGNVYSIRQYKYRINGKQFVKGGRLSVYDGSQNGSYLRVTNGTLGVDQFGAATINVGDQGFAGEFRIDHAEVFASQLHVGAAGNSTGKVLLGADGKLIASTSYGGIAYVGDAADGTVILNGAGSKLGGKSIRIGTSSAGATGTIIVNHADALVQTISGGDLFIDNPVSSEIDENIGLIVNAGRVEVSGALSLGNNVDPNFYGAAAIYGGTLRVGTTVKFRGPISGGGISGGKLFLHGGELNVSAIVDANGDGFHPTTTEQFYWDAGAIRYRAADVTFNESQILDLTKQGALSYRGDRRAGAIATGQILASDGTMGFIEGDIGLTGGTISPTGQLRIDPNVSVSGYGTISAEVVGTGAITNDSGKTLAIGALGGTNTIQGSGPLQVGHLNQNATYGGQATGSGGFYKVGTGTQTVTGTLENTGGVYLEQGGLAFVGDGAGLAASQMTIADGATLELRPGSSGTINGTLANVGQVTVTDATLMINGSFVNEGLLTNNGTIGGIINNSERITGSGNFTQAVDILAGAVLAPGNSVGIQTFEDLKLHPGGAFEFQLSASDGLEGIDWDLTSVSGLLSWAAISTDPFVVAIKSLGVLGDFDPNQAYSWRFIAAELDDPSEWTPERFAIDISGFETGDTLSQNRFSVIARPDGLYLNYAMQPAAVPEPGSLVLLLALIPLIYFPCYFRVHPWLLRKALQSLSALFLAIHELLQRRVHFKEQDQDLA